jgi:hypothetical protein
MSDAGPPLDPRIVAALRDEPRAPGDARARARDRLAAVVPLFGGPPDASSSAGRPPGSAASGSGALGSHAAQAALVFVLGALVGAGVHSALVRPPAPRIVYVSVPESAATAVPKVDRAIPGEPPIEPSALPTVEPRPAPSGPSALRPAVRGSQLVAERAMLDDVRAAVVRGDAEGALERLKVSRREFPRAILDEERDALTVEALVAAHRYEDARAAAESFRRLFPASLFTPTIDGALRSIPSIP